MDQPPKINRKLAHFRLCRRRNGKFIRVSQAVFTLALVGSLCLISSAQEVPKSKPKSKKNSSQLKQFVKLGRFEDRKINESSGVVMAKPAVVGEPANSIWTFNDSGGKPVLFRVGIEGQTEGILNLEGATNRDWESMCSYTRGETRYLAVGDVGDNVKRHPSCRVYVVAEPDFKVQMENSGKPKVQKLSAKASKFEFSYEDGANNCEAMGYNAEDSTYWFVEKVYVDDQRKKPPGIYVLSDPLKDGDNSKVPAKKHVARRVADFPVRNVTGMEFSSDNKRLVIRTYFGSFLYEKVEGKTWLETVKESKPLSKPLPLQSQGEAVCFFNDSESLLLTSELTGAFIWQVRLKSPESKNATTKEKNETSK